MENIYDTANQMAKDLASSEQVIELKNNFKSLKDDSEAFELYKKVQSMQIELQSKQESGSEITEEDMKQINQYTEKLNSFPMLVNLMASERKVAGFVDELNKIITQPLAELYSENNK